MANALDKRRSAVRWDGHAADRDGKRLDHFRRSGGCTARCPCDQAELKSAEYPREFRLEDGLPVWVYHVRDLVLEKRVMMPHLQNTVYVTYRILAGDSRPRLELRPAFHFRHHEIPVNKGTTGPYSLSAVGDRYEVAAAKPGFPPVRMKVCGDGTI